MWFYKTGHYGFAFEVYALHTLSLFQQSRRLIACHTYPSNLTVLDIHGVSRGGIRIHGDDASIFNQQGRLHDRKGRVRHLLGMIAEVDLS